MPIPDAITREHVLTALEDLDAGVEHPFGEPTKYELVHKGKRYPPKAVIGVAARHATGGSLGPDDFSGGEAAGQANSLLRRLGFEVAQRAEAPRPDEDWSDREVELVVADHFEMLRLDLLGQPYGKTDHRRGLMPQLDGRSKGSVEFKHQNISAVLVQLGYPYINGYKPRGNFQSLLADGVEAFLREHPRFFDDLATSPVLNPAEPPPTLRRSPHDLFELPPERIASPDDVPEPWRSRRGRRIDFVRRDAENRRLGRLGEEFALHIEKQRLSETGRDDLANRVEWVADTQGDGFGFDILSFDERDDTERYVEVKTTGLGKFFPFYVTSNELACSEACSDRYRLFRVFEFSKSPGIFVLKGALSAACRLRPVQFRATI